MKIQYISYNELCLSIDLTNNPEVTVSSISKPKSFDEFDINVIDISNPKIWKNSRSGDISKIDCLSDFKSINEIIKNTKRATSVVILPQNVCVSFQSSNKIEHIILKDVLDVFSNDLLFVLLGKDIHIEYEISETIIGNKSSFVSDLYFSNNSLNGSFNRQHMSKGKNLTTIVDDAEKLFITTLKIESFEDLVIFLESLSLIEIKEKKPKWFDDIKMFDDVIQTEKIMKYEKLIKKFEEKKKVAQQVLSKNNEYKSVLYTNGDELVSVVFMILEQMLDYDLSGFIDQKKEDFNIKIDDLRIIGEIKGVTSNVKSEHISQLDVHYQSYLDESESSEDLEDSKSVLIINPLRNKPINGREPIHENQIRVAERNNSLIIDTYTLLKIFEKFKKGELTKENIMEMLRKNSGLLKI